MPLVALLGGTLSAEIQLEIARALAGTADKVAIHPALMHLATLGKGDDAAKATERLAGFDKKATYGALGTAAKHPEAATRRAAAQALRSLNKPQALTQLAGADVTDKDTGEEMLAAIRAIYAGQSLDFVLKGTKSKTAVLQRSAVATLGDMVAKKSSKKNRKTIVGALDTLSKDGDPLIRAAAARSYGTMPGADVAENVKTLTKDKALEVQRAIAKSLSAYPGKETNVVLLGFAGQPDVVLKSNALASLGALEVPTALDAVVTHLNHDDARVRRAATGALVAIGGKLEAAKRKPMLSFFSERVFDKDADVRLKAVKGLELVNDPRTVTALAALLQDPVLEVRQATLMAMASTGDGGAAEPISTGLEDDDVAVRRTAIEALGALNRKEGKLLLEAYAAKEQDKALADLARATLKKIK
jgi:HEAT repeat protein